MKRRYNDNETIQRVQDIAIDESGRVYVAGVDMVGVYEGLPNDLSPTLYAKKDCRFDYGLSDNGSF